MKYKNFGNRKSSDIRETNLCVMELKNMSELRSARTNPFHEWLEEVAVVRRALHLCVKVPVGGILPQLQEVDCLFIQSSSSQLSSCSPLPWLVMFGVTNAMVSRSNLATRRSCQRPTRPPRRCSRLAGYEGNAPSMTLSVVKDFSDNLVDEEPHHLNPLAQNLHQNFKGGILMNRRNEMGGVRLERMQ